MTKFLVFSANWEIEVEAKDFTEAVLVGTKSKYDKLGMDFNIAQTIVVVKEKTQDMQFFNPVAVFEDLHLYYIARHLKVFLES